MSGDKLAAAMVAMDKYMHDHPGHKVGVAFDTRDDAKKMREWVDSRPRTCEVVVTYFNNGVLTLYNKDGEDAPANEDDLV